MLLMYNGYMQYKNFQKENLFEHNFATCLFYCWLSFLLCNKLHFGSKMTGYN